MLARGVVYPPRMGRHADYPGGWAGARRVRRLLAAWLIRRRRASRARRAARVARIVRSGLSAMD